MKLIKRAATAKKDTKEMKSESGVNGATSGFMKLVSKVTNIYHVLCHYFVVNFSCLYKSLLLVSVPCKLVALIFPQNYLLKPTFLLLCSLCLSPIKCLG